MSKQVRFVYRTGLRRSLFTAARLHGSWDAGGRSSDSWTVTPMQSIVDDAGCPAFAATVDFPDDAVGTTFRWGVSADGPGGADAWAIPTEVCSTDSRERTRSFTLGPAQNQLQEYFLTYLRRLGANKVTLPGQAEPGIGFAVWAPNARSVELVFGSLQTGYIDDAGGGTTSAPGEFPMTKDAATGIWSIDSGTHPALGTFAQRDHGKPYMFKVTRDDGSVKFRTDLYSRCQIGAGKTNPGGQPYAGIAKELDGTKSCSVVVDPEKVQALFDEPFPQQNWLTEQEFWKDEFDPQRPLPARLEDLVIYELHVPGLAAGDPNPGRLSDAIALLDHLVELGINAVELLPMAEYKGYAEWGYATSHYCAIEFVSGGRDQFKHFVRACHRRGIAVILDVVYNHYTPDADRAEWCFDSDDPTRNIYYWYEGSPTDYPAFQQAVSPDQRGNGGYVDNDSTGWQPRLWEEPVRQLFISSAAALMLEFHVDGFRVDQTSSLHSYAKLHADGRPATAARVFGAKFLREWTTTMRLLKPGVFLIAEDHSGWSEVTAPAEQGGLGFDATWYSNYYHHLVGDTGRGPDYANLLRTLASGDDRPLALDTFAGVIAATNRSTVVYHESHDEAGNSKGDGWSSHRTIQVAVNSAPLIDATRLWAEARVRVAAALTLLSAGVPMFFMGEELGFQEPYRYDDFMSHRESFPALRAGEGKRLLRFYQDLLALRAQTPALRGGQVEIVYVHNANRVLAFRRRMDGVQCLVVASFGNGPFNLGYDLVSDALPAGHWREVLNSDAAAYGGSNVGNLGATIPASGGRMTLVLPASAALVLKAA